MEGLINSMVPTSEGELSVIVRCEDSGKSLFFDRIVGKNDSNDFFTNDHLLEIGAYLNRNYYLRDTFPELMNNLFRCLYDIHPLYIPTKNDLVEVIQPIVAAWFCDMNK